MEGRSRNYYERRIQEMILELEEEINTLEFQIEESDWDLDSDYSRQLGEIRSGLERAGKAAKDIAISSEAVGKDRFKESERNLRELGNKLKDFRTEVHDFLLE